eukprot:jgi/Tetstr1/459085/TSEL_004535.t1
MMEREAEAAASSQKELTAFLDHANHSRLQNEEAISLSHIGKRILFGQVDAGSGMWTVAIPTARTVMSPHESREVAAGKVDDLFKRAVPLGNTVPRDEVEDKMPDAKLPLTVFNVVTGSYDPRSLKATMLEFKTMRYEVKYTTVP